MLSSLAVPHPSPSHDEAVQRTTPKVAASTTPKWKRLFSGKHLPSRTQAIIAPDCLLELDSFGHQSLLDALHRSADAIINSATLARIATSGHAFSRLYVVTAHSRNRSTS
jgi:hypothetical protein